MRLKTQRAAVLRDRADNVIGRPVRNLRVNIEGDLDRGSHQASQMLNDLFSDSPGVASRPCGVESNRAKEAFRRSRDMRDNTRLAIRHRSLPCRWGGQFVGLARSAGSCRRLSLRLFLVQLCDRHLWFHQDAARGYFRSMGKEAPPRPFSPSC
jgi:hypothetical protein